MARKQSYKIKGKRVLLVALRSELRAYGIGSYHSVIGGFVRVEIRDSPELTALQDICRELGLSYEIF